MRYNYSPSRKANMKRMTLPSVCAIWCRRISRALSVQIQNDAANLGNNLAVSYNIKNKLGPGASGSCLKSRLRLGGLQFEASSGK
jgi:hypothetical protein